MSRAASSSGGFVHHQQDMRRFLQFVIVAILILAVFPLYSRFKVAAAPVPPGVYLGGRDLSMLKDPAEIRQHLDQIYQQPIDVRMGAARLVLLPEEVDFHVDVDQMVAEAGVYLEGTEFLDIAVREAFGFDQQRRDIPIRFMLDSAKLRAWLENAAAANNHGPAPARLIPPSPRWTDGIGARQGLPAGFVGVASRDWTWVAGKPGETLDIEASIPLVVEALTQDGDRVVRLVVDETPPPAPSLDDLAREINTYLLSFPGFGAAYVQDLTTGAEAAVDADVAFSGMSTMKIGIAAAVMAKLPNGVAADDEEAGVVGQWMDYALGESNNHAANQLLGYLGSGDIGAGTANFTQFMRDLGMVNSYMQSGYDAQVQLAEVATPGNQRTDWDTNPDHNIQSTPEDMGRILANIYACSQGTGPLLETFGEAITPAECSTILYYMSHDEFQELVWAGLPRPQTAWIVHKHGFAFESHSDVALVWGPTGPYVISVFLFQSGWVNWNTSNSTMKSLSRIVWNFFEFQRDHFGATTPEPLILTPPPGYRPIKEYIKIAATGYR
jgi:hypothetical protein